MNEVSINYTNSFLFVHNELFFFQFYISNYTTQPNFV